jgi:hypothetical protein
MTPTDWGLLVSGLVPFLVALTAWLRAEVANRASRAATTNSVAASANARLAVARTNVLIPPAFPQGGVPVRPDLPPDNSGKTS